MDNRYKIIKDRLQSLSKEEIQRIVDNVDLLCLDTYNFDEQEKKYCPLAIAMNLHETVLNPTNQLIKYEIGKRFTPVNIIAGVDGNFYRENRKDDIVKISTEILNEKSLNELKRNIEINFKLDVHLQEEMFRLVIDYNKLRIHFDLISNLIYASVHGTQNENQVYDNAVIENHDHVIWYLLQFCKDVHKWGEFKNEN